MERQVLFGPPAALEGLRCFDPNGGHLQKPTDIDIKRYSEPVKKVHGRIEFLPFHTADVAAIHVGIDGQVLLREASLDPDPPQIPCHSSPRIHAREASNLPRRKPSNMFNTIRWRTKETACLLELHREAGEFVSRR